VPLTENFDGVSAPDLPAAWTNSVLGEGVAWSTTAALAGSVSNSACALEPGVSSVSDLYSPVISISSASAQLSFRNFFDTASGFEGGALEIRIGDGPFADIADAGGYFVNGGYSGDIDPNGDNPLAGRRAWTGTSGGFLDTIVILPGAAAGQSIQLAWRFGSDSTNSVGGGGWSIDTVTIDDGFACCTVPPEITLHPTNQTVVAGNNVTFRATATGMPQPACQWFFNDGIVDGATAPSLVLTNVQSYQEGQYWLVAANSSGAATSEVAVLTVIVPPSVTAQFSNRVVLQGLDAVFQPVIAGTEPLSYQWRFNGTNLDTETSSVLTLSSIRPWQAGDYSLIVTNAGGAVTSEIALLSVSFPPAIRQVLLQPGGLVVTLPSIVGVNYQLEYKDLLTDPEWWPLSPAEPGTGDLISLSDTNPTATTRFYRIRCY
jgi:hypothetical protein